MFCNSEKAHLLLYSTCANDCSVCVFKAVDMELDLSAVLGNKRSKR